MLLNLSSPNGPFCSAVGIKIDFAEGLEQNRKCPQRLGSGLGLTLEWTFAGPWGETPNHCRHTALPSAYFR